MEFSQSPWQPLADDVYLSVAQPCSVNLGLVVGHDSVLLIDTGSTPDQGRAIADSAQALLGRAITHVVITHEHHDHLRGLPGVGEVTSIAHESVALSWQEDPAITTPIARVKGIDLGGRRVEIVHHGRAHTAGDLVVHVPDRDLVFCGDLVETNPYFGPDTTVESWPAALDGILGAAKESTLFVPGHGAPTTTEEVFKQRADISTIYGQAEHLVQRGVTLETALAALDQPTVDDQHHPGASPWPWPFTPDTIKAALPLAYAELAAQGRQPRTTLPLLS